MVLTKSRRSKSLKSKKFRNKKTKKVAKMRGGGNNDLNINASVPVKMVRLNKIPIKRQSIYSFYGNSSTEPQVSRYPRNKAPTTIKAFHEMFAPKSKVTKPVNQVNYFRNSKMMY
jgi:hypothetical protein